MYLNNQCTMQKNLFFMLLMSVLFSACSKEEVQTLDQSAVKTEHKADPMYAAKLLAFMQAKKASGDANMRFGEFPNIPIEYAKNIFDDVLAVYVPLKEGQTGGELNEHTITVYPALEVFEDGELGECITGTSAAHFLMGTIDELIGYVQNLDLPGYKYISYIYTTVYTQDDQQMVMNVHFGLVNRVSSGNGPINCTPPLGTYNPVDGTTWFIMDYYLNNLECNPNLKVRIRNGANLIPPHPSTCGGIILPGYTFVLAYSGTVYGEPINKNDYPSFYTIPNPNIAWSETVLLNDNFTSIFAWQLKDFTSAFAYNAQEHGYFGNYLMNYGDVVGYGRVNYRSSTYFLFPDWFKEGSHTTIYYFQKLKWVAIPDPANWGVSLNAGLTPELNP